VKPTSLDADAVALPTVPRGVAIACGAAFVLLLAFALWWPTRAPVVGSVFTSFWRAGSLVFGGGHVVLPLLEASVVDTGWMGADVFLAGYGAAQAIPGPMFSVAAFLGAQVPTGQPPVLGATAALIGVFAPGFLLLVAILPVWTRITASGRARAAIAGVNAAVVGLLAAALYDPVVTSGIVVWSDAAIAAAGVGLLWSGRRSPLLGVIWCVAVALTLALLR
jgi:chromate transporter